MLELTGSTQVDLAKLVNSSNVESGELIAAEFQSSGRGRVDRTFEAAESSALLFSFYLTPKRSRRDWGFIAMLAALSIREVIFESVSKTTLVKWPNDVLIGERKVAGILAESTTAGVIIGIGLNVEMYESELPVDHATSLAIEKSSNLNRSQILINFLNNFEKKFSDWDSGLNFTEDYITNSATIGRQIQVQVLGRPAIEGLANSITEEGALLLADGSQVTVGDVVHLR